MKATTLLTLLGLGAISHVPTIKAEQDDSIFTLVLLQMITQRQDPGAMQQLYPILLSSIMGGGSDGKGMDKKMMYYLLLGAGNDPNMHQWLPLILNNKNKDVSDKLLMLLFMQQNAAIGGTGMDNLFPLLLLNANDEKYCNKENSVKCYCTDDNSELLLYIMLLNGNSVGPSNPYGNFMFMLFDNDKCDGTEETSKDACTCSGDDDIQGGINAVTYMMMMKMNPQVTNQLPEAPPQRAVDIKDLLKKQMFQNLGPEYAWMANVGDHKTEDLMKFQMYQSMGVPPSVMSVLSSGGAKTQDERFALIQWLSAGSQLSIETMSLMLGIQDAKQFYIHSMIEEGQVDPLTASLLLASLGGTNKNKMKEMLIMAATGQIDPATFATINKPYVPELPKGVYPGQDLYFIHLELLDLNTCALVEPKQRKACGSNFGTYITAEQCEVHPYCCYNPYFGEGKVPWCYYNIFFVFHDQYKLRVKEADQFKGPQDCPGLFRYGLNLDPFMYFQATKDIDITGADAAVGNVASDGFTKLQKLVHVRHDVGFPGITEFHCRAIKGACWDNDAGSYPAHYAIPQCFTEIQLRDKAEVLNLYDPELFKPKVPEQFLPSSGECDTNYFHISTLYYERRACTYTIDMIKYGSEFSPLNDPTREDCLFRLGCCYEDDESIMSRYPFMPRCFHRVKDINRETRLNEMSMVLDSDKRPLCGSYLSTIMQTDIASAGFNAATVNVMDVILADKSTKVQSAIATAEWNDNMCLYKRKGRGQGIKLCVATDDTANDESTWSLCASNDWSNYFDIFDKTEELRKSNVPTELQDIMSDLF